MSRPIGVHSSFMPGQFTVPTTIRKLAGRVNSNTPGVIDPNRTSKLGSIFETSLLGPTLVHEGKHVDQLKGNAPGREAVAYAKANKKKLEEEASQYEKANYKKP